MYQYCSAMYCISRGGFFLSCSSPSGTGARGSTPSCSLPPPPRALFACRRTLAASRRRSSTGRARHQAVFTLEVLPSVPAAAALHRRHCFTKLWWLRSAWRSLQLHLVVDLRVFKWEVIWSRVEQRRQQEEMERRAEDAHAELVFRAQRQLTHRKGPHWGLGPSPGPRLSPEWVAWEQKRRALVGQKVRLLVVELGR